MTNYGTGARFKPETLVRDMLRDRGEGAHEAREMASRNFFGESYPLQIVNETIGLRAYLEWLQAPSAVPDMLASVAAQRPADGFHTVLTSNPTGCLRQLGTLGSRRGQWLAPNEHPVVAHLRYMWLQWEHDTGRVHSAAHLAPWESYISQRTLERAYDSAGAQTPGVEPWCPAGGDFDAWGKLQDWIDHQLCRGCLDHFIQSIRPSYQFEEFHVYLSTVIERFTWRPGERLIVNVPPRGGKSQQASVDAPPWQIAQAPWKHLMSISYARALSKRFSTQARSTIRLPYYQRVFPHVRLDKGEAGEWTLSHENLMHPAGEFYASGLEGGIAGRGFHIGTNDDLLNEQTMYSENEKNKAWQWWHAGFLTREMDPGRSSIGVISTRYAHDDPVGRLLEEDKDEGRWTLVKIPALLKTPEQAALLNKFRLRALQLRQRRENLFALNSQRAPQPVEPTPHYKVGSSFSPIRRPQKVLEKLKRDTPKLVWTALQDQEPSAAEGNIILRNWWNPWQHDTPPYCEFVFCTYDTAFEPDETADYSARLTWGVFPIKNIAHLILLEAWRDRVGFPDLKAEVKRHYERYRYDLGLVEAKASGKSLVQDMGRMGPPLMEWLPPGQLLGNRAKGKIPRGHASSPVFHSGLVYYMQRPWADKVISEVVEFPGAAHDDWYDCTTMAAMWFRQHGHAIVEGDYNPRKDADPEAPDDYADDVAPSSRRGQARMRALKEAGR